MSEKKVVGRGVAIGLGLICIILIVGLVGVFAYYTIEVGKWKVTYDDYASTYTHTNSEFNSLNTTYQNYLVTHSHTDSEYDGYVNTHIHSNTEYDTEYNTVQNLQNQINTLRAPLLIRINLGESDNRPWFGTPYLRIESAIVNVGTNTAYNCKIHVIMYQGATIAKDTYVLLGTISGRAGISTTNDVQYVGSTLAGWTITLECTS